MLTKRRNKCDKQKRKEWGSVWFLGIEPGFHTSSEVYYMLQNMFAIANRFHLAKVSFYTISMKEFWKVFYYFLKIEAEKGLFVEGGGNQVFKNLFHLNDSPTTSILLNQSPRSLYLLLNIISKLYRLKDSHQLPSLKLHGAH